jgi:hypothetical protein
MIFVREYSTKILMECFISTFEKKDFSLISFIETAVFDTDNKSILASFLLIISFAFLRNRSVHSIEVIEIRVK